MRDMTYEQMSIEGNEIGLESLQKLRMPNIGKTCILGLNELYLRNYFHNIFIYFNVLPSWAKFIA